MKNHHEVGHFKNRLMILLLSLFSLLVMAGQSFATDCRTCHGMPPLDSADGSRLPSSGAFKGSHQKHLGANPTAAECTKCHGNSGYANDHATTSGNKIQIKAFINSADTGTYSKSGPFAQSAAPLMGNCSNVNCHFENNSPSPVWGDKSVTVDCNTCHATPRSTGSHTKHVGAFALGATMTCASCHLDYGTTNFSHATSAGKHKIVVKLNTNYSGGTAISWLPSKTPSYGSCSTYCHSNGSTATVTNWGQGTVSTGCNFCHPNLTAGHAVHIGSLLTEVSFYNYTSTKSTGAGYKFGCVNCHPFDAASHINNLVDVDLTKNVAGGHLKNLNGAGAFINGSRVCANVYCHSNGYAADPKYASTPVWGTSMTGDKCANCHGNSPNSGIVGSAAHSAHVVGIHYDDIFNGVSKKLPQGGGQAVNAAHGRNNRSTTINCNICHNSTVTVSTNDANTACVGCHNGTTAPLKNLGGLPPAVNKSNHVNGIVDVVFIGEKIATKAQLAGPAFAGYTAANAGGWSRNSNSMIFKTYTSSYDVSKRTLLASAGAYSAAGCSNVACHNGITVKWTDTLTCTSCHTRLK